MTFLMLLNMICEGGEKMAIAGLTEDEGGFF
jgi:hypothetical protein